MKPTQVIEIVKAPSTRRRQNKFATAIDRLDGLPALAASRNRLLEVLADGKSTPQDLATVVESDVALVVAVMRLANARPGSKVHTVDAAIRALNPAGLETVACRIGSYSFFEHTPGWVLPPERFRLHAVSVARIVDMVAREIDHPHRGALLVAALLHDIGKVVMAEAYPDYDQPSGDLAHSPDGRARAERLEHGVDQSVIGGVVLRRWRLPKVVAHAVERHHAPDADGEAGVLRLADMLSHYERGAAVRPSELHQAATRLGIRDEQLRTLMYRVTNCGETRRPGLAPSPLSVQERAALRGLAAAKVYKEIGRDLNVAASTVRSHLHNVCSKLGAADRAQAVLMATREGWL